MEHGVTFLGLTRLRPESILVLFSLIIIGCGTKESSAPKEEPASIEKTFPSEPSRAAATPDKTVSRRADRSARRNEGTEKGHSPDRTSSRKWAEQDRYMRLALDRLELSEDQLTRISDLNWEQFIALEKQRSEAPSTDDVVLKMLETGDFSPEGFEPEVKQMDAVVALQEAQYKERLRVLHDVLDKKQRNALVGLVEAEEKKQYALEDKQAQATDESSLPTGCGDLASRFFERFVDVRSLNRDQRRKLSALQTELNKDKPDGERMKDLRQAGRIYDLAVRKSFVRPSFDIAALNRPKSPQGPPVEAVRCRAKAMSSFLEILTPRDRKVAAERLKKRIDRRQGSPNANADAEL